LRSQPEALNHVLADHQLVQVLQVGKAFQEKNALDQLVGVAHFLDRFVVFMLAQRDSAPVLVHAGMQEILVDGGEFHRQCLVQILDDFLVAFHGTLPKNGSSHGARGASFVPECCWLALTG
jgi:hypothetical protein